MARSGMIESISGAAPRAKDRFMEPSKDEPLPATLQFCLGLGAFIAVGWVLMFLLLQSRW